MHCQQLAAHEVEGHEIALNTGPIALLAQHGWRPPEVRYVVHDDEALEKTLLSLRASAVSCTDVVCRTSNSMVKAILLRARHALVVHARSSHNAGLRAPRAAQTPRQQDGDSGPRKVLACHMLRLQL